VEDSIAELKAPHDSPREISVIDKKLFISHKDSWLGGVMRYRTEFVAITQVTQAQRGQWHLPVIPLVGSLLAGIRLNKKI
jgi:hypothetical protein